MAGNVQLSSNFAKAPLGPAQVWWIFSTKKNKHTNGHQPDYLPNRFLTAVFDCFFFLSKAQSWVSRTRASSIRMASLIMEDLRIGWIDKSSVKMSNISKLPWGCTAHCTHTHNLGLEQMRLSQYSAEYFQKVKFLQYLKDQADILQKFSKRKCRHEEATFHLHISLLQNMDQDGRNNCYFQFSDWKCNRIWNSRAGIQPMSNKNVCFFTLRVVDWRNECVQRSIFP